MVRSPGTGPLWPQLPGYRLPGHPDPAGRWKCTLISIAVPGAACTLGSLLASGMALAFLFHGWSLPLDLVALETMLLSQLWAPLDLLSPIQENTRRCTRQCGATSPARSTPAMGLAAAAVWSLGHV